MALHAPFFRHASEAVHLVGMTLTLVTVAVTVIEYLIPHSLTASHTLLGWQWIGVAIGAVFGYLTASFFWAGKGRSRCLDASWKHAAGGLATYALLVIGPLWIAAPGTAERFHWARVTREILLVSMPLFNTIEFFGATAAAFLLAGSIVTLSPKLANPKNRLYE